MKKLTLFFLLILLAEAGFSQFGRTESPYNFEMIQPNESEQLVFEDSSVVFYFTVEHKTVGFILQNKTNNSSVHLSFNTIFYCFVK